MKKIVLSLALITGLGLTYVYAADTKKVNFSVKNCNQKEGDMNNLKKTNKKIEDGVVGTYNKIETGVVGTYDKIEKSVVGAYQKIEDKFVSIFLKDEKETENL